ncbi:hypothetical protein BKA61DRAFT_737007 [Leptodontidium sp. MPI-SDFR-AT-0119]|nr:hypothetical protein BKA61DRAFT_737007 [Leptodontidium sp. MPI-SDFR-AT-0119]
MEERVAPFNHEAEVPETTGDRLEKHQNDDSHHEHQPMPVVPEKSETASQGSTALETAASRTRRDFSPRILLLMADLWIWEILSCVLATICLVVIVAILDVHQDRPLPQWPNYISINSLIAIMTAIMKASLMLPVAEGICQLKWLWFSNSDPGPLSMMENFESGSRGPWGAFMLMVQLRKHYLASLGALLTIVMLAANAFSQQIIQYNNCTVVESGISAYLSRGNNYSGDAVSSRPGHAEISGRTAAAMSLGVMDAIASTQLLVQFGCASGNCCFPSTPDGAVFSTLGMCFRFKEISDQIRRDETNGTFWVPTRDPTYQPRNLANSTGFDDLITADMLMLRINETTCGIAHTEKCSKTPWAVRSSLIPCIKTYSAIVNSGKLNESRLSTTLLKKTNVSAIEVTTWSLTTDTVIRNGQVHQCETSETPSTRTPIAISVNNTLALSPTDAVRYYEPGCVWVVESLEALAQNQLLSWQWDVEWFQGWTDNTITAQGTDWLRRFYHNGTASMQTTEIYMEQLTGVITTMMREHEVASGYVQGDVLMAQTCIGVAWLWLALPGTMVFLVAGFLAATMSLAAADGSFKSSWRSSALAPFFHGLDESVKKTAVHSISSRSGMENVGKTLHVKMIDRFGVKVLGS